MDVDEYNNIFLSFKKECLNIETYKKSIIEIIDAREFSDNSFPLVSFILVGYNEGELVLRCLKSIFNQKTKKTFEIIFVDNGLDSFTASKVKEYNLLYLKSIENVGPSTARNIAALYSCAEILASIDSDGIVDTGYLDASINMMQNPNIVALRGKVLPVNNDIFFKAAPKHYDLGNNNLVSIIDTEGNFVVRKEDFLQVGGMEDGLFGHEGAILCYRMVKYYGFRYDQFCYSPDLVLYHNYNKNLFTFYKKMVRHQLLNDYIRTVYPLYQEMISYYNTFRKNSKKNISYSNILLYFIEKFFNIFIAIRYWKIHRSAAIQKISK